jgi:hypothetical protein
MRFTIDVINIKAQFFIPTSVSVVNSHSGFHVVKAHCSGREALSEHTGTGEVRRSDIICIQQGRSSGFVGCTGVGCLLEQCGTQDQEGWNCTDRGHRALSLSRNRPQSRLGLNLDTISPPEEILNEACDWFVCDGAVCAGTGAAHCV